MVMEQVHDPVDRVVDAVAHGGDVEVADLEGADGAADQSTGAGMMLACKRELVQAEKPVKMACAFWMRLNSCVWRRPGRCGRRPRWR